VLRDDFARPVDRFAAGLRAAVLRELPALDDFAREDEAFFAVLRFAVDALAVEREELAREPDALLRPVDFFAPPLLRDEELEPAPAPALPSIDHLPDITR
jgi:hypothetical protein